MKTTYKDIEARYHIAAAILLEHNDKELLKATKVKLMNLRIGLGRHLKQFREDVQEAAKGLAADDDINAFVKEKYDEEADVIDVCFTDEEYADIIDVNSSNDAGFPNGARLTASQLLEAFYELFVESSNTDQAQ
ncbi:MAG: hypothetical protein LBR26_09450 [Prevotella sp.]|jgi:hypothetical protein|nr:hypothetical protein [Prevotella sp.]